METDTLISVLGYFVANWITHIGLNRQEAALQNAYVEFTEWKAPGK